MMGPRQEAWLADGLRHSVGPRHEVAGDRAAGDHGHARRAARGWSDWLGPDATDGFRAFVANCRRRRPRGPAVQPRQLGRLSAARRRLLRSALDADANLVVLSGDSHNAWAFDLDLDGHAAGIEIAGQSVTSPGNESDFPAVAPADDGARDRRPEPAAQMGESAPARLCDPAPDAAAGDRGMAVPAHRPPARDAHRRAARDDQQARRESLRLGRGRARG